MTNKRKTISSKEKIAIFQKTGGRCHICAKRLKFDAKSGEIGMWQVDHIHPKIRGGKDGLNNYLAICNKCNRLRWYLDPKRIKRVLQYGVIACNLVKNKTRLGEELHKIHSQKKKSSQIIHQLVKSFVLG